MLHPRMRQALAETKAELTKLEAATLGAEAVLADPELAADCLAFYRCARSCGDVRRL
jgi:hypothetical protein